jgi:hypothetical protein
MTLILVSTLVCPLTTEQTNNISTTPSLKLFENAVQMTTCHCSFNKPAIDEYIQAQQTDEETTCPGNGCNKIIDQQHPYVTNYLLNNIVNAVRGQVVLTNLNPEQAIEVDLETATPLTCPVSMSHYTADPYSQSNDPHDQAIILTNCGHSYSLDTLLGLIKNSHTNPQDRNVLLCPDDRHNILDVHGEEYYKLNIAIARIISGNPNLNLPSLPTLAEFAREQGIEIEIDSSQESPFFRFLDPSHNPLRNIRQGATPEYVIQHFISKPHEFNKDSLPAYFLISLSLLSNFIGMLFISLAKSGGSLEADRLASYSLGLCAEIVIEFLYTAAQRIIKTEYYNIRHDNIQVYLRGHLLISSLVVSAVYNERVLGEKFNPILTDNPVLDNIITNMLGHLTFAMISHLIINYHYFVDSLNRNARERNMASNLKNGFLALVKAIKVLLEKTFKASVYFAKTSLGVTLLSALITTLGLPLPYYGLKSALVKDIDLDSLLFTNALSTPLLMSACLSGWFAIDGLFDVQWFTRYTSKKKLLAALLLAINGFTYSVGAHELLPLAGLDFIPKVSKTLDELGPRRYSDNLLLSIMGMMTGFAIGLVFLCFIKCTNLCNQLAQDAENFPEHQQNNVRNERPANLWNQIAGFFGVHRVQDEPVELLDRAEIQAVIEAQEADQAPGLNQA